MDRARTRTANDRLHWGHAISVLAGAFAFSWWLIGDTSLYSKVYGSFGAGPYHFAPHDEVLLAAASGLACFASLVQLQFRASGKLIARNILGALAFTGAAGWFAALNWRVMTAAVDGGNIGAGMVLVGAPFGIPALLIFAHRFYRKRRPLIGNRGEFRLWTVPRIGGILLVIEFATPWLFY